ncbi:hypothetical protein D3C87_1905220 [compost metagenome]
MLTKAWAQMMVVSPMTSIWWKGFSLRLAIAKPRWAKPRNSPISAMLPTSPSSSAKTAKMKSACWMGR